MQHDPHFLFSLLDITTLDATDSSFRISGITHKIAQLYARSNAKLYPAAFCTWSVFMQQAKKELEGTPVKAACVSGNFPSGQTFLSLKVLETITAIENGADEIDLVIDRGRFLGADLEHTFNEIVSVKNACGSKKLKVIIETGELKTAEHIVTATEIAARAGADFVKTSTGKSPVSATPEAATAICRTLRTVYEETGKKIGFKASGGIATYDDAVIYANIVKQELGEEWLTPAFFRIGASRLANDLLRRTGIPDIVF